MTRRGTNSGPGRCACLNLTIDANHNACFDCVERAFAECPVLDTHSLRWVKGYPRPPPYGWRKLDRGRYESPGGRWIAERPWMLDTPLRARWIIRERMEISAPSDCLWFTHDADWATMREAVAYALDAEEEEQRCGR